MLMEERGTIIGVRERHHNNRVFHHAPSKNLSGFLDRFSDHRRAPRWSMVGKAPLRRCQSAAAHLSPGEYRTDRDFIINRYGEVKADQLTDATTAVQVSFGCEKRLDKSGSCRGITSPNNKLPNPSGPGDYKALDGTESNVRVHWPSVPAWSVPVGEPQMTLRERKKNQNFPGPGAYVAPSHFDAVGKARQPAFDRLVRCETQCRWEGQFSNVFKSIHASDRRRPPAGLPKTLPKSHPLAAAAKPRIEE